jgi:hypothetical protein
VAFAFLRLLLIGAFVPLLIAASVGLRPALVILFLITAGMAWLSLRLWASDRWKPMALLLAAVVFASIWALAIATTRR